MDEGKGKSAEIEEWMKELLPDGAADIGMWQHSQRTSAERPNTYQLSVDSNAYPRNLNQHQLVQTSSGCNSTSLMVKQKDPSFNVLQHTGQTTLQKILETQSGIIPERVHPRVQMPAFHQSQNLTLANQLKPGNQTQAMLLGPLQASSDSTPQVELTSSIDWVNQAYHEIQQMKEMYLSVLFTLHNRAQEMRRRATNAEMVNKSEKSRTFIERIIKLLNMSRSDLLRWRKEKLYQIMNDAMNYLCRFRPRNSPHMKQTQQVEASVNHFEAPQIQQRDNYLQPGSLHLRQGGALSLPQSSLNSFKVGSSAGVHKVDASLMVNNASQCNPLRSTQWTPQGSVVPSPHKGSQTVFDQRALRMLLHPSNGVSQHNNLCTSQQTAASSRNIFNSLDYSVSSIGQAPASMSPLQNNQQDPAMKRQKMKQPVQQLITEKNKQQMLQKRNEDTKLRRFVGLNQRWSPVLPPSSSPYTISPQNSQQSSSQIELKDLSSKFSKSATPSLSASLSASPSALPSPLTPLTPSSNLADSAKSPLIEESSKLAKNDAAPAQLPLQDKTQNQVSTDAQRLTKSCLHRESTCSGDKESSHAKGDPLKRLVEVVKSISSKALNASLRDINAVTNLTDRIAGHFLHCDPTKVIFHDLVDDINNCDNETSSTKLRIKRELDTVALNDSITEMELYSSGRIKRLKIEPINLLLQEIKDINKKLIEVVVDVMTVEEVFRTGSDEGTLVRCSYIPIGLSRNIRTPNNSKLLFPNLLLDLIVPADYPNSSPAVLETVPLGFSDGEEGKYLWMKAKSRFSLSLRKLSHPISVKEMAETWDVCARDVFHEIAELTGGGDFSSTYGKWENCAVAG